MGDAFYMHQWRLGHKTLFYFIPVFEQVGDLYISEIFGRKWFFDIGIGPQFQPFYF